MTDFDRPVYSPADPEATPAQPKGLDDRIVGAAVIVFAAAIGWIGFCLGWTTASRREQIAAERAGVGWRVLTNGRDEGRFVYCARKPTHLEHAR